MYIQYPITGKYRPVMGQVTFITDMGCGCRYTSTAMAAAVSTPSPRNNHDTRLNAFILCSLVELMP